MLAISLCCIANPKDEGQLLLAVWLSCFLVMRMAWVLLGGAVCTFAYRALQAYSCVLQAEIILQGRFLKQVDRARSMARITCVETNDEHQRWWGGTLLMGLLTGAVDW